MVVVALVVETFEEDSPDFPVVRHEFLGRTAEQAESIYRAHLQYDAFLRSCVGGDFHGMRCRNVTSWKRYATE
jgi:nitrate reductase alpha subunit